MESELCMKCGRERKPGTVFCDGCLAEMEKYPVKPGVVVLLPNRHNAQQKYAAPRKKHHALPPEEQVAKLKKRVISLWAALILALAAMAGLGWYTVMDLLEGEEIRFLPGQNYSSQSASEPSGAE